MTSRAPWIVSSITTSTPRPRAAGEAATRTALTRFSGPSAESADAGRIAPVRTTGTSPATTRCRSQAVSSSVFVPCVTTMPSASPPLDEAAHELDQVREVGVRHGVGAEAAERDLGDLGDRRQLGRDPGQEHARLQAQARLEVGGEVQAVRAQRVDGAAGGDDGDARQAHARSGDCARSGDASAGGADARSRRTIIGAGSPPSGMPAGTSSGTSAGRQCGAAAGGVNRATRAISRRIRSPSTGPQRVHRHRRQPDRAAQRDGVGACPEVLAAVVEVADAAVRDDRQPEARVAQLRDDPQADGLDRPPGDRPVPVPQVRLAGVGAQAQALHRVDRRDRGAAVPGRQVRLPAVVVVGRDLEDHRVAAPRDRAPEGLLQDRREREVHVVARGVELDRRDLARPRPLVARSRSAARSRPR